jgi:hypothetical protein
MGGLWLLVQSPHTGIFVAGPKGDLGYRFQAAPFIKGLRAASAICIISLMVAADGDVYLFRFVAGRPDRGDDGVSVAGLRLTRTLIRSDDPPIDLTTIGVRCGATAARRRCIGTNVKACLAIV